MPTARYPVLLCRDLAGGFSAVAIDDGSVGFGPTPRDATADLREFLRWKHRKTPELRGPDFHEPELRWFAVNVRPEYRATTGFTRPSRASRCASRAWSAPATAASPRPTCRCWASASTTPTARTCSNSSSGTCCRSSKGTRPRNSGRTCRRRSVTLAEVVVPVPREAANAQHLAPPPPTLARVAEPVGDRAVRKGYARAWGREAEIAALVRKLHHEKANVLLVGDSGVGKTTLMVDAVKEAEKLAAEADPARGQTAAAILAHLRRPARCRDEVPRAVGGARRGNHRGAG